MSLTTVREAAYQVLRDLGMTKIFGNPGSTELPFLRNLPSDFSYVLALHERTAVGMGLGYAMARGRAGFVNLHSIASVGNGLAGLVDAHYCHAPLVVTTGQQDRRHILAEHLSGDVYQQPLASRWTFPRTHPLFRGRLLPAQQPLANQLAAHDLVVVLGAPVFLYYAYVPGDAIAPGTQLFQIANSPSEAASALAGTSIVGNAAAAARYLREHTEARKRNLHCARKDPPEPKPEYPITPAYLFSVLNKVMPRNAVVSEECPSSKGDLDRYLLLDQPGSFYSVPNGILGFGLPAAVGLQLAHSDRRVVCPVGDGSIQYSIQALWTAVQYNAAVIFIVLRNGDYSALKSFCDFTHVGGNVPGMELPGIAV